jgi:hypothetical protein
MNRLAPKLHLASLIMGAWFYMTAVGNFVAGKIGEATGGHGGEMSKANCSKSTSCSAGSRSARRGGAAALADREALDAPRYAEG